MKHLAIILLFPSFLLGCWQTNDDRWEEAYVIHQCGVFRDTPAGHTVCAHKKASDPDYATSADLDSAVDMGFVRFYAAFPEFTGRVDHVRVVTEDDYCRWDGTQFVSGVCSGAGSTVVWVCVWTRRSSGVDPGSGYFLKRPPYSGDPHWRYTDFPLVPALVHELLHTCIGDPNHTDPRWKKAH